MSIQSRSARQLVVGDRVVEAPKATLDHCVKRDHPDFEKICKIIRNRRVGKVVEMIVKRDSRGHAINYAMVLWDELKTPSQHHVMRLRRLDAESSHAASRLPSNG